MLRLSFAFVCVSSAILSAATAQTQLFTKSGVGNDQLGATIDNAGDVDGDGRPDLIYGAPSSDPAQLGYAEIVSPATGVVLRHWDGTVVGGQFGLEVANVGDYDGDGCDDLAIASEIFGPGTFLPGRLRVYSGSSGTLLVDLHGSNYGAQAFGASVAGIGDLDGDGKTELLVGAWDTALDGRAYVISSIDSHAIYTFDAVNVFDAFGFRVAAVGDVDGDHVPDFAISAPQVVFSPGPGYVNVYSGRTGGILRTFAGNGGFMGKDLFGQDMRAAGDVDGDGVTDLIIGASGQSPAGYVRVYSLRTGALLHEFTPPVLHDQLGVVVSGAGDVDGDGHADLVVVDSTSHSVSVRSGASGAELYHFTPAFVGTGDIYDAVDLGDVDGDGHSDFAISQSSPNGAQTPGRVQVYRGFDCPITLYCTAKVNSAGCTPSISFSGAPSASSPSGFVIRATGELNNKLGSFFYSLAGEQAVPFLGGTLCVKLPIKRTGIVASGGNPPPNDCSGSYSIDFNAYRASGVDPLLVVGASVSGQFWSRDPGFAAPNNSDLTAGVHFTICQ